MRRLVPLLAALSVSVFAVHCADPSDAPETGAEGASTDAGAAPATVDAGPRSDAGGRPDAGAPSKAAIDAAVADARVSAAEEAGPRDASMASVEAGQSASKDAATPPDSGPGRDAACPQAGHITYTLVRASAPTAAQQDAYTKIDQAMKRAVDIYNCQADLTKALRIEYNPGVQTADGNANGNIRFGNPSTFEHTRAMHEIAHTVGVGTASRWASLIRDGVFVGAKATAQLRKLTGKADDVVHADSQHFWPYGLNYASEVKSDADLVGHCLMVVALRADLEP
jgi:hypothetical protein